MKQVANAHRSNRVFSIGEWVYLKLQPYRQHSLKSRGPHKLLPKFYGPFKISDKVGSVAYTLELPSTKAIHNVFHVSQLKLCTRPPSTINSLPQFLHDYGTSKEPEEILERKMVKRANGLATKVLIKWKGFPAEKATWEFYQDFISKFPSFDP
ncbi:hypothetical protein V2J09_022346 [Rumex salicifolius]